MAKEMVTADKVNRRDLLRYGFAAGTGALCTRAFPLRAAAAAKPAPSAATRSWTSARGTSPPASIPCTFATT